MQQVSEVDGLALGQRGPKPTGNEMRFWRLAAKGGPNECWPWSGVRIRGGYGNFRETNPRRMRRAHRFAYEVTHGPIPSGLMVLHTCDNPACVNPRHLKIGTALDNTADMFARHRARPPHKLSDRQVVEIRRLAATGLSYCAIGRLFTVDDGTVGRIVKGLSRRGVQECGRLTT
jgi:hypothetical protein